MADTFNAYHKWLGIPLKDQPPNLYRLLGVELFEADADVISAAADQRMVYLRSFQSGKHAGAAEALLNEIATARVCLLTPERRESYDRLLRAKTSTLPAPRPMTPGAVQQELALANVRTASDNGHSTVAGGRDTVPTRVTNTQEVPLASVPVPGKASAPPPRKPGPLPMATYAPSTLSVAGTMPQPSRPLPPQAARSGSLPMAASAAGDFFARLPQRALSGFVFLVRLPGVVVFWLLRTADNTLLGLVGNENSILHNFLRVVVPVTLAIGLAIGGYFGAAWTIPRVVAALRERAAQQERDAAARNALAARPRITNEFVMPLAAESLPHVEPPLPFIPPPITPTTAETTAPILVAEPPVSSDTLAGLRHAPSYTTIELQENIAATRLVESLLDILLDPELQTADRQSRTFEYRQAMRDLAHTFTFARDVTFAEHDAVAAIVARANNSLAKRRFFATRAINDLKRPGPDAPGLIVSGTVTAKRFHQGLYQTEIDLDTRPATTISVVSTENLAELFVPRSSVVVVGTIIDTPTSRIVGYQGPDQPVIWGGRIFAAPVVTDVVASLPVDPPDEAPPVDPPAEDEADNAEPLDPTADLLDLARFATALQNGGQPLEVPTTHPSLARWIATGLVQRQHSRSWGPEQAEGPPNTGSFGDRSTAWASASRDDQQEWLELYYSETVAPSQVHVVETYCPGALTSITGFRGEREINLWRGVDPTRSDVGGGTSVVKIAKPFPTNRLRIYLNSPAVSGWNEIDAVGMVDDRGRMHWAAAVLASSSYAGEDHPPFAIDREGLLERFSTSPALMKELLRDPTGNGQEGKHRRPPRD